ncbi:hypothetical protein B0H13DRAFT_2326330 [Mycena leptocephala]|nr:hypothetical protein B0H13DRAFT_2326330 [Mycena leptocephala]
MALNHKFNRWRDGAVQMIISTSLLGLGTDYAAVRDVINVDLPYTMFDFQQQIDHGGHDILSARGTTLVLEKEKAPFIQDDESNRLDLGKTVLTEWGHSKDAAKKPPLSQSPSPLHPCATCELPAQTLSAPQLLSIRHSNHGRGRACLLIHDPHPPRLHPHPHLRRPDLERTLFHPKSSPHATASSSSTSHARDITYAPLAAAVRACQIILSTALTLTPAPPPRSSTNPARVFGAQPNLTKEPNRNPLPQAGAQQQAPGRSLDSLPAANAGNTPKEVQAQGQAYEAKRVAIRKAFDSALAQLRGKCSAYGDDDWSAWHQDAFDFLEGICWFCLIPQDPRSCIDKNLLKPALFAFLTAPTADGDNLHISHCPHVPHDIFPNVAEDLYSFREWCRKESWGPLLNVHYPLLWLIFQRHLVECPAELRAECPDSPSCILPVDDGTGSREWDSGIVNFKLRPPAPRGGPSQQAEAPRNGPSGEHQGGSAPR